MAFRTILAIAVAVAACKGSGGTAKSGLDARCQELAKTCGDNEKHVASILDGCKQAAQTQGACEAKVGALYACYESQLCGKSDRVWAMDDLGVLAKRKGACVAEQKAVEECK